MATKKTPAKKPRAAPRPSIAQLDRENQELRSERDAWLEREAATGDILRMIARAPADIQVVLDGIAERAAKLCDAEDVAILRVDGNLLRSAAHFGPVAMIIGLGEVRVFDRGSPAGRAVIDRQTIHIPDLAAAEKEFPKALGIAMGVRTILSAPLLRDGVAIGVIHIRRKRKRAFTSVQIKLLETFADQAVIAIENTRLFQELTEALEQQTATSDILAVISSAPTELQPVFDTIAQNSVKLCGALFGSVYRFDGELIHMVADCNYPPAALERSRQLFPTRPGRHLFTARAILDRSVIHVSDVANDPEHVASDITGFRSVLAVPMLRGTDPIGAITVWHSDVGPFSQKHVTLLQTFADQAVIAIENARLFQELQVRNRDLTEALEQQTATSDVLRVISSSPTDVQPVFDAIVRSATQLCEASFGSAHRFDGQLVTIEAQHGMTPEQVEVGKRRFPTPATQGTAVGRAILRRNVVHIEDVNNDPEYVFIGDQREFSFRTVLAVPLLKEGVPIGALGMWRRDVKPFTENQTNLVKTFADQAVIAIENVRLFQELTEALEQQTATSQILGVIASSPTDIQPVLDVIAANAARVGEATDAAIFMEVDGVRLRKVANYGEAPSSPIGTETPLIAIRIRGERSLIDKRFTFVTFGRSPRIIQKAGARG